MTMTEPTETTALHHARGIVSALLAGESKAHDDMLQELDFDMRMHVAAMLSGMIGAMVTGAAKSEGMEPLDHWRRSIDRSMGRRS